MLEDIAVLTGGVVIPKKKEDKENTLLGKVMSMFTSKLGDLFSKLTGALGPLLKFALPGLVS